ncbi:MAG: acyltransferase [Lachnospiraceae bacterium]|nr:acyltransferase [Lachnospiraceae bacterium]
MDVFKKDDSQALKGIAIWLMVFHHCFRAKDLFEKYTISFFPFSEGVVIHLALMGKMCVAIFAFISGYGLFLSYGKKKTTATRWAASRYVKTFSGFWFIYVILAIANIIVKNRFAKMYFGEGIWVGIASVLLDFTGLAKLYGTGKTLIGTWWYMSAAIVFILLMPLLYKSIKGKPWLVLVSSIFFLRVILVRVEAGTFTGNNSIYAFIPAFLSGTLFARKDLFNKWANIGSRGGLKAVKCLAEFLVLCVFGLFYNRLPLQTFWDFRFCIVPVAFIMFCVEFIIPIRHIHEILVFFGKHSMNIFLVHTFIRAGYLNRFTYSWKHFALVVIMLFMVSLVISITLEFGKKIIKYNSFMDGICIRIENR